MATANPSGGSDAAINQEIEKLKENYRVTPPASEITSLIADIKATKIDASKDIVQLRPIMDHIFLAYLKVAEMRAAPTASAAEAVPVARIATNLAPVAKNMGKTFGQFIVRFSPTAEATAQVKKQGVKYQSFDGSDLSPFRTWVTTFLNGINMFKPTEQEAFEMALYLMQDKDAEMTKHLSGQVDMTNLKNLLKEMDQIFNTSGNQEVSASLFESLTQKENVSVQEYAYQLEHLFNRAYPSKKWTLHRFSSPAWRDVARIPRHSSLGLSGLGQSPPVY